MESKEFLEAVEVSGIIDSLSKFYVGAVLKGMVFGGAAACAGCIIGIVACEIPWEAVGTKIKYVFRRESLT